MRESQCPSLHRLGLLLKAAYRVRNGLVVTEGTGIALSKAQVDLERVHKLICRHREFCPLCKINEVPTIVQQRATLIRFDRAS